MTRETYMNELNRLLGDVPQGQRDEWLFDYEMHFRLAAENGVSEEEAARQLGDPRMIAHELRLNYRVHQAEERRDVVSVWRAVVATVSLGFFNLIFVLGPFIGLMGVLLGFWAVSAALFAAAGAALLEAFRGDQITLQQGVSLASLLTGLGLLSWVGTLKLTRGVFSLTIRYLSFNSRVIRRGKS